MVVVVIMVVHEHTCHDTDASQLSQVVVTDVADGCAASGRLVKGDRLVAINGEHVADDVQARALAKAAAGAVAFSILRAEELLLITGVIATSSILPLVIVTLALIRPHSHLRPRLLFTFMPARLAFTLTLSHSRPSHPLSSLRTPRCCPVDKPEPTTRLGLTINIETDQGAKVVVTDVSDGGAASGLLVNGDKIVSINGSAVTDEVQGRALAKAAVGEVAFSVQRGNGTLTITGTQSAHLVLPSRSPPSPPSPSTTTLARTLTPSPPPSRSQQLPSLKPPRGWESPSRTSAGRSLSRRTPTTTAQPRNCTAAPRGVQSPLPLPPPRAHR